MFGIVVGIVWLNVVGFLIGSVLFGLLFIVIMLFVMCEVWCLYGECVVGLMGYVIVLYGVG